MVRNSSTTVDVAVNASAFREVCSQLAAKLVSQLFAAYSLFPEQPEIGANGIATVAR